MYVHAFVYVHDAYVYVYVHGYVSEYVRTCMYMYVCTRVCVPVVCLCMCALHCARARVYGNYVGMCLRVSVHVRIPVLVQLASTYTIHTERVSDVGRHVLIHG